MGLSLQSVGREGIRVYIHGRRIERSLLNRPFFVLQAKYQRSHSP